MRPTESQCLMGDPTKARELLHWDRQYKFADMIREMTLAELESLKAEKI